MSLGTRIKQIREERGMNMTTLAKILGVSTSAVSNWEGGNMVPRPPMLTKVAQALGVTKDYLETGATVSAVSSVTADDILKKAKMELASCLKVPVERIKLELNLTA